MLYKHQCGVWVTDNRGEIVNSVPEKLLTVSRIWQFVISESEREKNKSLLVDGRLAERGWEE